MRRLCGRGCVEAGGPPSPQHKLHECPPPDKHLLEARRAAACHRRRPQVSSLIQPLRGADNSLGTKWSVNRRPKLPRACSPKSGGHEAGNSGTSLHSSCKRAATSGSRRPWRLTRRARSAAVRGTLSAGGGPDSTRNLTTAARWSSRSSQGKADLWRRLGDHHRREHRSRTDNEVYPTTPAGIALPSPTPSAGREGGRGGQVLH